MPSNEFRILGVAKGESADAALHDTLLAHAPGVARSELLAAQSLVELGFSFDVALRHVLGPDAVRMMLRAGASLGLRD